MSDIEHVLRYKFNRTELLEKALTHRSYARKNEEPEDNERLEFLGDSVISLVVCDYLFSRFPHLREDSLSKLKSSIVSQKNLASWAQRLSLGEYVRLSDSERSSGGAGKDSIIAGCLEAIVGAIFLDGGFPCAQGFVHRLLEETKLDALEPDSKSILQEITQSRYGTLPVYRIVSETGPAHNKIFEIVVEIEGKICGRGRGSSKKDAQKNAAEDAIRNIEKQIINKSQRLKG